MNAGTLHALCSNSYSPAEESVDKGGPNLRVLSKSAASSSVLKLWSQAL